MNLLFKKSILVYLFFWLFPSFALGGIADGASCNTTSDIICASIDSSGNVVYSDSGYSSAIDFQDVVSGLIHILHVDTQNWDFSSNGSGFVVSATSSYTLNAHFYMLMGSGGADFGYNTDYYIINDKDRAEYQSDYSKTYLVFENKGTINQTWGDFINQGQTSIIDGGVFNYIPTDDNYFYTDYLKIENGEFVAKTKHFSVRTAEITDSTVDLYFVQGVVTEEDTNITIGSNVDLGFHGIAIDNDSVSLVTSFTITGSQNTITFDQSARFMWYNFKGFTTDYGPQVTFDCSEATCSGNSLLLDQGEFHTHTLYIMDNADFYISIKNRSRLDIENLRIYNSNVVYDVDSSTLESSLARLYTDDFAAGEFFVSADSTLTLNTIASTDHFHDSVLIAEGEDNMVMNFSESSKVSFSGEIYITAPSTVINFLDSKGTFNFLNITGITNVNIGGTSRVDFWNDISGADGHLIINVANDALVTFSETNLLDGVEVVINQEVYTDGSEHNMLRFEKVSTFMSDNLVYHYNINPAVKNNDFSVKDTSGPIVLIQIRNDGPKGDFQYIEEVSAKINGGGDDGGDGGDGSSFSVLIVLEGATAGGDNFIGYEDILGVEYADFGLGGVSSATYSYVKAQEQYGEEAGLLTLTTIENMDSYGIAVVFDNIVLSETDTGDYRVALFNLVINNSRTVEQLGQTLNSLGANITLSNIAYSSSLLEINSKKNAISLLGGDKLDAYAEMRNLTNDNFEGNYLTFGGFFTFYEDEKVRLGISGFFSPYTSTTIFDAAEQSNNAGASLFGAFQIGTDGGAIMFDFSFMHSLVNGVSLEGLSVDDKREYNYGGNSVSATVSYNFGRNFSQRMVVSAFSTQSVTYTEKPSNLALHVITPSYYNAFAGYYSQLLNTNSFTLEVGVKYYFKEGQKSGTAGFINDPTGQEWAYQYIVLDSPVELNVDLGYQITQNLEFKATLNKRGTYSNFGFYLMYKKSLYGPAAYGDEDILNNQDIMNNQTQVKK